MPTDCISYQNSGYFSSLMNDYLNQKEPTQLFYNRFPNLENFEAQIKEKKENFDGAGNNNFNTKREALVTVLKNQYSKIPTSDFTKQNIEALASADTFTITTGHQLNLF